MVEHARPDGVAAREPGRGDHPLAALTELTHQSRVELLEASFVGLGGRPTPEADHSEGRRRHQLQLARRLHVALNVLGQVERTVDSGPEGIQAEVVHRQPDLDRAAHPGQLQPVVGEVHLGVADLGVLEVVGMDLEGLAEQVSLAHQQGSALEGLVEPLVRVQRDGVREPDAGQLLSATLGDRGEPTVGGVDVQPDAVLPAHLGQLGEQVDRTGVGGAGDRHHDQRTPPGGDVGGDRRLEGRHAHPELVVDGEHPDLLGSESEGAGSAGERRVALRRDIGDQVLAHRTGTCLPSTRQRGQVGRRPTRDQDAAAGGRVVDPVGEPPQHGELEVGGTCRLHPVADVDVVSAGDQVSECARPGALSRDVREVAGVVDAAALAEHVPQLRQDLLERRAVLGRTGRDPHRQVRR